MNKARLSAFLRNSGLLQASDRMRFLQQYLRNSGKNRKFKKNHPEVKLPPPYLVYESFQMDYAKYYEDSIISAKDLIADFAKHISLENASILDWGCGPGRIIRHFHELLKEKNVSLAGTDYNARSVKWCSENLENIEFKLNGTNPPLAFEEGSFDVIWGISIFTHLSGPAHDSWFAELDRVLKPDGIIWLSMQGDAFLEKLLDNEKADYQAQKLVVRGKTKEGHRTYSAFHPENYLKDHLFKDYEILEHRKGDSKPRPQQDVWIIRKR